MSPGEILKETIPYLLKKALSLQEVWCDRQIKLTVKR